MKTRVITVSLLAIGALLAAPTAIKISMLAAPLLAGGGVLVVTPNGAVQVGALGAGLSLVSNGIGGWTLVPATGTHVYGEKPSRNSDGSYSVVQSVAAGSLRVFRNGVRQSLTDDYTFDTTLHRITPGAGWQADDLVLVDYSR